MQSIDELRGKVESLREEIATLADAEELTTEQDERFDAALVEFDEVRSALEKAEKRAADVERIKGFASNERAVKPTIEPININTRTSPFDVDELRSATPEKRATELRARALDVAEKDRTWAHLGDAEREALTRSLSGGKRSKVANDVAELVIGTGSAEYRDLFEQYLEEPWNGAVKRELEDRQAEIYTRTSVQQAGAVGALFVPYALDSSVILTNAGVVNPLREICRTVQITGTNSWNVPTSAGVTAAVLGETVAASDNTPTFTSTNIPVYKQAAWAFGSFEAVADIGDLGATLSAMFADAKNRSEASYFTTGTGSSQPTGIVTYASNATSVYAGSSGAANAADLIAADIYGMRASLSPRWRQNSVWLANLSTAHYIRQFGTSTNFHAFTLDLTQDSDQLRLLGKPFYEVSDMDSTVISGSTDFMVLHCDPTQFVIVDRVGMQIAYEPMIYSGGKVPTGEQGWFVYWRSGSGGSGAQDAFRLLKL